MRKVIFILLSITIVLTFFACNKSDQLKDGLQIDTNLPQLVNVRYEVEVDHSELYNLDISYTYGETYFDFILQGYVNNELLKSESDLDLSFWSYETTMKKGSILYIATGVISKENISAIEPGSISVKIFVDGQLIKCNTHLIFASCEYIYGALEQNSIYYMYTQ